MSSLIMENEPDLYLSTLSERLKKDNTLEKITDIFIKDYQISPYIGAEIEFYLSGNVSARAIEEHLPFSVKKEKGHLQYEIDLPPSRDLTNYCLHIQEAKRRIKDAAGALKGFADFRGKPYPEDYGSSMHIHINFIDPKKEKITPIIFDLDAAARSLCYYMLSTYLIFVPRAADYMRSDEKFMAPTHVSYGNNNRTVAIRVPDSSPRRLEHRLSTPEVDPYLAMCAVLKSIILGMNLSAEEFSIEKTYGNAFDAQYKLIALPASIEEAKEKFIYNFFDL